MPNIVYVLTNPAMPGIVKIGMTDRDDVQTRMNQLYSTGVPLPFDCVIARQIEDRAAAEIENALHTAFDPHRINPSREFFEIDPEQVEALLLVMPGEDVTPQPCDQNASLQPEDRQALDDYKTRKTRTSEFEFMESLNQYGVPVYERVLALGNRQDMLVKWGIKGFSLNVRLQGQTIVICYGFPPSSVYNQSIYTDFTSITTKSNLSPDAIATLRQNALDTGLFVPVGGKNDLACRTNRHLAESELSALTAWLEAVVVQIRQSHTTLTSTIDPPTPPP